MGRGLTHTDSGGGTLTHISKKEINMLKQLLKCLILVVISVTFACLLPGCKSKTLPRPGLNPSTFSPADPHKAQVSLFLSLIDSAGPKIWIKISSIEIVSETGEAIPLLDQAIELDAKKIDSDQIFISRKSIPPGNYKNLRVRFEKAYIQHDDRKVFLALGKPLIDIPFAKPINFKRADSHSLFIQWDTQLSVQDKAIIIPAMHVKLQSGYLLAEFAYVACPDADTVYFVRTDTNRVIGSIGVSGRPTYLATDITNRKLYILASKEAAVKVFDLESSNFQDSFKIPMTQNPSFMVLAQTSDPVTGEEIPTAYILEEQTHYLVRMNLNTGELLERIRIKYKPQYATYIPQFARLAVSAAQSQAVYLLDPITLITRETIPLGGTPQGMLVKDNLLFITEDNYRTVTIYDLNRLQIVSRLDVGLSPRRILLNNNRLYITNYKEGSVSIISPRQLVVSRKINLGKSHPLEIASSLTRRWIYVGDEEYGGVTVIDPTTNKVVNRIHLGSSPLGIAIIQ